MLAKGKARVSLYKALLFRKITDNIKSGSLNLQSSYKFKALDDYMIPKEEWDKNVDQNSKFSFSTNGSCYAVFWSASSTSTLLGLFSIIV